jgi:lysophospholipid acyltransferase (LPLAT)-like uncharacterized protein
MTTQNPELGDIPQLPFARRILVAIVHRFLHTIFSTLRITVHCEPGASLTATCVGQSCILAMWHGEQLVVPFVVSECRRKSPVPPRPLIPIVSKHSDGRLIAQLLFLLGFRSVGGSSGKGGSEALRRLVRAMRHGAIGAITVDGPRGPRHELKPGIIKLAQLSGAPISGVVAIPERCYRFRSWDRMFLPLPFSRIKVYVLTPRHVAPDENEEEVTQALRADMLRYHGASDRAG